MKNSLILLFFPEFFWKVFEFSCNKKIWHCLNWNRFTDINSIWMKQYNVAVICRILSVFAYLSPHLKYFKLWKFYWLNCWEIENLLLEETSKFWKFFCIFYHFWDILDLWKLKLLSKNDLVPVCFWFYRKNV